MTPAERWGYLLVGFVLAELSLIPVLGLLIGPWTMLVLLPFWAVVGYLIWRGGTA
jgi:hypothetical protein